MSTILLWQFDKFLKKNKIAAYNHSLTQEIQRLKKEQAEAKLAEEAEQIKEQAGPKEDETKEKAEAE